MKLKQILPVAVMAIATLTGCESKTKMECWKTAYSHPPFKKYQKTYHPGEWPPG